MNKIFISFLVLFLFAVSANAKDSLTVDEIVKGANLAAYYAARDGKAVVNMTITDSQGRERKSVYTMLRLDVKDAGEQKFYVYFSKPSDLRKMVYMVEKKIGANDDRWLYLPALDLVKRVAATDKRSSFVGSHFVYEDVSGRDLNADKHELVKETDKLYILKNTPKIAALVGFSYYTMEIRKDNLLPVKAEYFDKSGKAYRIVESVDIKNIQGFPTVTKARATDLSSGGSTVIEFSDVKYDIGIKDKIFTERYLRRPPKKLLKK